MYLLISAILLAVATFFLYEGIGNIVRIVLLTISCSAKQIVTSTKGETVSDLTITYGSSIIWTVAGLILFGISIAFLAAFLVLL